MVGRLLIALTTVTLVSAQDGWITLFDGRTLNGWEARPTFQAGNKGDWSVVNGALVCGGAVPSWIATNDSFSDYRLTLQFRGPARVNSGVFLRAQKEGQPHVTGYELQIWDYQPAGYNTGSLVGSLKAEPVKIIPNEWNTYDITAKGDRFTVVLNGKKVLDASDPKHSTGVIGFQCQKDQRIEFRDIKLQPLKSLARIGMGGIVHETNTFNPKKTTVADFEAGLGGANGILRGDAIVQELANSNNTIAGFIEGAKHSGLELYPTLMAGPQTIGAVTREAFDALTNELTDRLKKAPKLDGILLFLHGTMVAEGHPHADAEVVRRVRQAMGDLIPIVVVHDFHANVSEEIVKLTTVLITYKECPHLDAKDRGVQAARIMADIVSGKVKPVQALAKPPMLYNIIFHNTYAAPLKPIVDESKRLELNPKILAASVPGGYQYADIPAMGPSAIVVTDNDPALAKREAERLSGLLWGIRDKLVLKLPDPAGAVKIAMSSDKFPIALMDTGDNIGGGSSGDSTFILTELLKQKAEGWVMTIADGEAVDAAYKSGVGQPFDQMVGGKTDRMHGERVRIRGRVKSLFDGRFVEPAMRHGGGRYWDMGFSAVIEVEGSTRDLPNLLLLTPKRIIPFSLHQLISAGIYPERQRILVVKGTVAPRAAYEPIAARIIEVDSGGVTAVNPRRFDFIHVRPNIWGLSNNN